jgi:hypothetical protein
VGVEAATPQFQVWQMFLGDCPQPAMRADEFAVSHALSGALVQSPPQIEARPRVRRALVGGGLTAAAGDV